MVSTQNWDPVPWAVGGGAKHSVNVARLVAHQAFGGKEGIVGPDDCLVRALAVPGPSVRVAPGAVAIRNRAAGVFAEGYAARLPVEETLDIPATDASGGQSYMVVARVENPHIGGEGWAMPADVTVGPYIFTRAIPCSGTAERITDLASQYQSNSLIPLARIDMPASTATVQQSYIKDLRFMVRPRLERIQRIINLPNGAPQDALTSATFRVWPSGATWNWRIPSWAVRCQIVGWLSSSRLFDVAAAGGNWTGQLRIQHGTLYTSPVEVNLDAIGGGGALQTAPTMMAAGDLYIPADHRGTNRDLSFQGLRTNAAGASLRADWGTCVVIEVTYFEEPDTQGWAT